MPPSAVSLSGLPYWKSNCSEGPSVHSDRLQRPRYAQAAAEILRRHDSGETEANITRAVRDFLILTVLVRGDEIVEENPPAQGSRRAVDLVALETFIEFKRRIGTAGGFNPNAEYVRQLDDYLEQSERQGRMRMGILTDGRRWLLRWPNAGPIRSALPYAFTLEDADRWSTPFEWLRDRALFAEGDKEPSRSAIAQHFGPTAQSYERGIAALNTLYVRHAESSIIRVKRQLWENLLTAALGEIAGSSAPLEDLFVRHTYLSTVIGMVIQASFGSDSSGWQRTTRRTYSLAATFEARPAFRESWGRTSSPGPSRWEECRCSALWPGV